ncbi:unnamed protein product [Heterobilharzia americana]|nr:unnamed protein product [Heterobilharzia americana]
MIEASSTVQTPGTSQISSAVDYDVDHRDLKESSSSSGSGNTKLSGNVLYKCDDQTTSVSVAPRFQSINFWSRLTLFRMLRSKPTRRALFIGCGLQIFQQFVGINTVMYYGAEILSMAGIGGIGSKKEGNVKIAWLTALVAFVNFFFSLSAPWIVGRFKRRLIFYCSLSGVFLSLIILGISFQLITSYSTPVSVIEPIPMGIVDENTYTSCLKTKTCDVCIQQKHCGFCYQTYLFEQTKVPVNGSCLPSPQNSLPSPLMVDALKCLCRKKILFGHLITVQIHLVG